LPRHLQDQIAWIASVNNMTSHRRLLPNRRRSTSFQLEHAGLLYSVSYSLFDDGTPAECFINNHKSGNASDVAARDAGIILSFALQHGARARDISRALSRNSDRSAGGLLAAVLDQILTEE
jgi:hypothetical protein